jgi:ectoine hydroxylase
MECLSAADVAFYREQGYLVVPDRVPEATLQAIRDEIARFEDEARGMTASNDRLDLENSHTPEAPRVRRIKRPDLISPVVQELLRSDIVLGPARDLLGPDIRLHTTKLNMKKAGYGAAIEWHQDWAFYPHTNDDVLAIGVVIDDIAEENGPLMVYPGSHTGPVHDHHANGVFAGAMDLERDGYDRADAVQLTAKAGALTIHHARIVHGSALNRSDRDRRLLFLEMMAADAFPIMGGMTRFDSLEDYDSRILCGQPTKEPRLAPVPVRIPQPQPAQAGSIYEIQSGAARRAFETLS